MQDQIYNLLISEDKLTWKSLIQELVKTEQLNPWDIDVSLLSKRYIEELRRLQNANFFVSGKMILASSILLKMKSNKLLMDDLSRFDAQLYAGINELQEDYSSLDTEQNVANQSIAEPMLTIKTPLPRKRAVTLNDLMFALQKALEVNERRIVRHQAQASIDIKMPEKKIDISEIINRIYSRIKSFFSTKKEKLTFTYLVGSNEKKDKIYSIISLLHLETQQKINLIQNEHFGEIEIEMAGPTQSLPQP